MKRTVVIIASALLCAALQAQNLNPVVEVTNEYDVNFTSAIRQTIPMAVPDSLLEFKKDFDYTVFDNPYKGAYQFVPFTVKLQPQASVYDGKRFHLCAGAGYTVHPVLDFVWSPLRGREGKFQMNVYQKGNGYWGSYRGLEGNGYDVSEQLGLEMYSLLSRAALSADVHYRGLFHEAGGFGGIFNSASAQVRVKSTESGKKFFYYDFDASYRFADYSGGRSLKENDINLSGSLMPVFGKAFRMPIDFAVGYNTLGQAFTIWGAPHLELTLGPVDINAGAKIGFCREGVTDFNKFIITPDVTLKIDIVKEYFTLYAAAVGGPRYNSFSDLIGNSHFNETAGGMSVCDADFYGGFRGGAAGSLHYDLNAGYALYTSHPFDADIPGMGCGYVFQGVNFAHVDGRLSWKSERVEAGAGLHYRKAFMRETAAGYEMPAFSGDFSFVYNYRKTIYAGVSLEGAVERMSPSSSIPGYVDLGLMAKYRFNDKLSLWFKGGNLLDMEIRRTPFNAEKGIALTAGICLSL